MVRLTACGLAMTLAVLATGCATSTQDASSDAMAMSDANDDALECRTILRPGSNVQRRLCGTPEQWEEYDRESRAGVTDWMRRVDTGSSIQQ